MHIDTTIPRSSASIPRAFRRASTALLAASVCVGLLACVRDRVDECEAGDLGDGWFCRGEEELVICSVSNCELLWGCDYTAEVRRCDELGLAADPVITVSHRDFFGHRVPVVLHSVDVPRAADPFPFTCVEGWDETYGRGTARCWPAHYQQCPVGLSGSYCADESTLAACYFDQIHGRAKCPDVFEVDVEIEPERMLRLSSGPGCTGRCESWGVEGHPEGHCIVACPTPCATDGFGCDGNELTLCLGGSIVARGSCGAGLRCELMPASDREAPPEPRCVP